MLRDLVLPRDRISWEDDRQLGNGAGHSSHRVPQLVDHRVHIHVQVHHVHFD